ncbi:tRNA-specific 2-thiouridylase MnmA [Candidatus Ecksteinia adelgidicola]|nr:tRNA-specific 2-thiouridylase MnmA [Candidatus Ecksteinia adelgidicola]
MLKINKKKVVVGISGGVDSSVAAYLLKKKGYQVSGLFMKNWEEDDNEKYCASSKDLNDAESICDQLKIKLHTANFSTEYWENVFKVFLKEYQSGRTPNPDVLCNKEIKFKTFLDFSEKKLSADFIATGHYVRRKKINGIIHLLRGIDKKKDQSYFLYTLSHKQIEKSLFPIGKIKKSQVRDIAEKLKFINANKKDSTGICFIGKRKFRDFLERYLPKQPGPIMSIDSKIIGNHQGLMYYTLGQRKGLGIGGIKDKKTAAWYVVDKDLPNNILIVAQGHENMYLMSIGLIAQQLYWVNRMPLYKEFYCTVKIRSCQKDISCLVTPINEKNIKIKFNQPVSSVTPGQSVVLYKKDVCLGGGIIEQRIPL